MANIFVYIYNSTLFGSPLGVATSQRLSSYYFGIGGSDGCDGNESRALVVKEHLITITVITIITIIIINIIMINNNMSYNFEL